MPEDIKKAKLERFMSDPELHGIIYGIIRDQFLKGKGQRDIQVLAAERLALDFLNDAWKEILKFKKDSKGLSTPPNQIGL